MGWGVTRAGMGVGGGTGGVATSKERHSLTLGAPRTAGGDRRARCEMRAKSVGSGTAATDGVEKGSSRAFGRKGSWWAKNGSGLVASRRRGAGTRGMQGRTKTTATGEGVDRSVQTGGRGQRTSFRRSRARRDETRIEGNRNSSLETCAAAAGVGVGASPRDARRCSLQEGCGAVQCFLTTQGGGDRRTRGTEPRQ